MIQKKILEKPRKYQKNYCRLFTLFILFIILVASICQYNCSSREALEILVYPPQCFISGTETSLRVIVLDRKTGQPTPNVQVTIHLKKMNTDQPGLLVEGKTNSYGSPDITLNIPEELEGECELMAAAQSPSGNGKVTLPISIKNEFRIHLTSDKTVYRPGQIIHMRGVVFNQTGAASNQEVSVEVAEPSGYSVLSKKVKTCNYGISETDFPLGDEIKTGTYTICFSIGNSKNEKNIYVTDDPLPLFNVKCQTEKTWYVPGQEIKGRIKAVDFLGKPLNQAKVNIILYKNKKEKSQRITDIKGITDSNGIFKFSYPLPPQQHAAIARQSSNRLYQLILEAAVREEARVETTTYSLPVSRDAIGIQLVPESVEPKIGLENIICVVTTYPDGTPAACTVKLENWKDSNPKNARDIPMIKTDSQGIGEFKLAVTPDHHDDLLHLVASDTKDNKGEKLWGFPIDINKKENLILRTGKSIYNRGETPVLTIVSTQKEGIVYLDLLKENQILLTRESKLEDIKAGLKLPIPTEHTGTLTCHARILVPKQKTAEPGTILADQRKIIVLPIEDNTIELAFQSSKKKYFPGEEVNLEIFTRQQGQPCPAVLGITIVDDSIDEPPPAVRDFSKENQQINKVMLASSSPLLYRSQEYNQPGPTQQKRSPRILYSNPRLITDQTGRASFNIKLGDVQSIPVAQWRVLALAHTLNGETGSGTHSLPVNHGLWVEMDLPPRLTREDEITIPVTVYNYQPSSQEVRIQLKKDKWFELSGQPARNTTVKAHDKKTEHFKIRATGPGNHLMKVLTHYPDTGWNDSLTQAVTVKTPGRRVQHAFNYMINKDEEIHRQLPIPGKAIKDSHRLKVKLYPGYFSQMVEGMETMLHMPHGCFEQTTSTLYPDVMVLDYLKETGKSTPEIENKAKEFIAVGYQKLLQYEATPGGFSFYGGQAQKIPTAFGLQLFSDMAKVYPIDKALIPRMQKWLLSQMKDDHWEPDGHFGATSSARDNNFGATAYVTSALLHSGLDKNNKQIKKAVAYLQDNYKSYAANPNVLSYCALSLAKAGKEPGSILKRLNKLAKKDDYGMYWLPGEQIKGGVIYSNGTTETTAVAALANLTANNRYVEIPHILQFLLKNKNSYGSWGSTQATVLTLKVLKEISLKAAEDVAGDVNIRMNNEHINNIRFVGEENSKMKEVDLRENLKKYINGVNPDILLKYDGEGELFCQILLSYYVRWDEILISKTHSQSPINLSLFYDTKRLNKGETVTVDATASYTDEGIVPFAIVDIGIPPGFEVNRGDFIRLRTKGLIDRYEINQGRLILYLNNLGQKGFRFGMKAVNKGRVKMPEAVIYDYYNPEVIDVAQPVELTVI